MLSTIKYYFLFLWKDIQLGWYKFQEERAVSSLTITEHRIMKRKIKNV